ncbi:MAG: tRNA-dihydrouridine synthase [Patescibacteria group bacterium]
MNFWEKLPAPFFVVAPMADVTDAAFRRMIAKYGRPDVMWTEFVAADGLMRATPEGKAKLMADLIYSEEERPIVAQLFSSNPEHMEAAAKLCCELGFDGIDINMGCPDKSIEKQGCGSAMIKTPDIAREIIRAAKRGAGELPVSVKTRIGYNKDEIDTWIPALLSENPAALTIHARTRKELSKAPAQWERVARVVALRDKLAPSTRIIGNGDVLSMDDARQKVAGSGADGAMIGRALFGNPWFFNPTKRLPFRLHALPTHGVNRETLLTHEEDATGVEIVPLPQRLLVMVEHTKHFTELLPHKNFAVMKKHYKAYVNGFPGAAELRHKLMEQNSAEEIEVVVHAFLSKTDLNALD